MPIITVIWSSSTLNQPDSDSSGAQRYPGGQLVKFSLALWGPYVLKSLLKADEVLSLLSFILPSAIPNGSKQLAKSLEN